jgi:RHH-type transcriptional regulator, rel operon repressor / antitoxin RelB
MKPILGIRLPDNLQTRLDILAQSTGRTKSYYVREAIGRYLEDMEDLYMADSALQRIRSGKEKTYTQDEVGKQLGLAD